MKRTSSRLGTIRRTVLTFDICSSSDILEDLIRTENIRSWRDLLVRMERYLARKSDQFAFNLYKFTGDGWILLFDYDCSGSEIFEFIELLSKFFNKRMSKLADDILEAPPEALGLTFGIDRGTLIRFGMDDNTEYIGRAINIACRLQSSIKDKDRRPQYKILMTKNVYQRIKRDITKYKQKAATRTLHNIAGGKTFNCVKVWLDI